MKRLLIIPAVVCLFAAIPSQAQLTPAYGNITAAGSTCATAGACVTLHLPSPAVGNVSIQLSGTFTLTGQFEQSSDNQATWDGLSCVPQPSGVAASSATAADLWVCAVPGATDVRVRGSAYTSGTAAVVIQPSNTSINGPTLTGAAATQVQGTAASGAALSGNPVRVGISDGTNAQDMIQSVQTLNSTGGGIPAVGLVCNYDDAATQAVTENQFAMVRCDQNRRLLGAGTYGISLLGDGLTNNVVQPYCGGSGGCQATGLNNGIGFVVGTLTFNGSTWDKTRGVVATADSTGTGIPAAGMMAQLDETAPQTVTENNFGNLHIDSRRYLYVRNDSFAPFNCVVAVSTATTIQAVGGSCIAPGAGLSLYISDIEFGSSAASGTAADSFPTLKSGTGGTCGSATAVIWQALSTANSTVVANLSQPIKVTANNEICWIMSTAGSKTIQLHGYIAP